jgi:transglutaminase-like putative cysteine protease
MKFEAPCLLKWYSATLGVAAGAVVYALLGFGPVLPGAAAFAVASYIALSAVRRTEEPDSPYQKLSEGIALTGMVLFLPLIFIAGFLIALVIFLGFAQLALNYQTHDYRRFYLGLVVSFAGICVGAAESKSGFYLVFFLAYALCAGICLGYAHAARRLDGQPPQWEWAARTRIGLLIAVTAVGLYLILPRFPAGGLLAQPGSDHFYHDPKWEAQARKNQGTEALRQIEALREEPDEGQAAAAEKKTLAIPDPESGGPLEYDGTQGPGAFRYDGFQKRFNINQPQIPCRGPGNGVVARMRADHPQYLRARIFDRFDGLHWSASSVRLVKLAVGFNGVDLAGPERNTASDLQAYEVFIEKDMGDAIPAAAVPVRLNFPATAIGVDRFGQLHCPGALKKGTAYAVTSQYNRRQDRLFAELEGPPPPAFIQLPDALDPRIPELAATVTKGAATQLEAAVALEQHLRTGYQYDLNSAFTSQNTTPLSVFLFDTRSGHCEYFASALAVMLRTRNIPARLVTGFSATSRNPLTGYFDIHALDAHAWVEAWVDDQGWVILEPTPFFDGPLPAQSRLSAKQINEFVEHEIRRNKVLGLDRLSPTAILHAVWLLFRLLVTAALGYVKWFVLKGWPWIIAAVAAGAAARILWQRCRPLWRAYRIHRRVAAHADDPPRGAVAFYLSAIEELLALAGFRNPPGRTIETYLQKLESIAGAQNDPALATAFNRMYYNGEAGEQQAARLYKKLFLSIYGLGFRNLQSMTMAGGFCSTGDGCKVRAVTSDIEVKGESRATG